MSNAPTAYGLHTRREMLAALILSSCPIAYRSPSSIPIATSCCIASGLGKWVTPVIREPVTGLHRGQAAAAARLPDRAVR